MIIPEDNIEENRYSQIEKTLISIIITVVVSFAASIICVVALAVPASWICAIICGVVGILYAAYQIFRIVSTLREAARAEKVQDHDLADDSDADQGFEDNAVISIERTSWHKSYSDEHVKEMMRNMSHELRTPLASMQLTVEGMVDGVFPIDADYLDKVAEDLERLSATVNAIGSYASVRSVGTSNVEAPFLSSYEKAKKTAIERNIAMSVKYDSDDFVTLIVPSTYTVLSALFDSVLSNAFEHAHGVENIQLMMEPVEKNGTAMIHISVNDDGCGIPEELVDKMIMPFWKQDASHTTDKRGQASPGLGLSVADEVMRATGGYLSVRSQEGVGTCVSMFFPMVVESDDGSSNQNGEELIG